MTTKRQYPMGLWSYASGDRRSQRVAVQGQLIRCAGCSDSTWARSAGSPTLKGWVVREWAKVCYCPKCVKAGRAKLPAHYEIYEADGLMEITVDGVVLARMTLEHADAFVRAQMHAGDLVTCTDSLRVVTQTYEQFMESVRAG